MVNKISLYKNLNQEVDQRWHLKPEARQSLPLHSIIDVFKELTTELHDKDIYSLSQKVKVLSEEKLNYYNQCLFRFVLKIFSSVRNWWNHGQFISSGQLGYNLSSTFIDQYQSPPLKKSEAPLPNLEADTIPLVEKTPLDLPKEVAAAPQKIESYAEQQISQQVIPKVASIETQTPAINASILKEPASNGPDVATEYSKEGDQPDEPIDIVTPAKKEEQRQSSSAIPLPSESILQTPVLNQKKGFEDKKEIETQEPDTPSSSSNQNASGTAVTTPQIQKFKEIVSNSPHAAIIRSLSSSCVDDTEKTYVEIIIHALTSCGTISNFEKKGNTYHLSFEKHLKGKPKYLPVVIKQIELNKKIEIEIARENNQVLLKFFNKSICVNPYVGFKKEIDTLPIERKDGSFICKLSVLGFTQELQVEEAINMWTETSWE